MRKTAPEDGVVHRIVGQQVQDAVDEGAVVLSCAAQAQLGTHAIHEVLGIQRAIGFQGAHGDRRIANQRLQGLAQAVQVPEHHARLLTEGIAPLVVAVVADVAWVEMVEKLERPVIDGQAQDAHVVGIEHAVAEAHGLPLRHQGGAALAHRLQERRVAIACLAAAVGTVLALWIEALDHVVGQLP